MGLKFEGALENINEDVINACIKFIEAHGITNGKVKVEVVGKVGENYAAKVRRLSVQNGDTDKPFRMVVKIAPTEEMARNILQIERIFQKESLIYTKVLSAYKQIEESFDVPKGSRFRSPLCYGVHLKAPHECIALEDMNEYGFVIADRFKSLTDDEIKLILNELAKYHALGFIFKEREKELYEEIKSSLRNMQGDTHDVIGAYINLLENLVEGMLDEDEHKKRTKGVLKLFNTKMKKMAESDFHSKHTIIIQADCWTNNFLFRWMDGKPIEAMILDYQMAHISSPAVDLLQMIFNCTDSETRKGRYYDWLDYYYENFSQYLSNCGFRANYLYPRDKFEADLQRYAKTALAGVFIQTSAHVRKADEIADIKEMDLALTKEDIKKSMENQNSGMSAATHKRFKEKIQGLVKDFISYGYI